MMGARPFYRWKGFWCGVAVLVVLAWGWVVSMGYGHEAGGSVGSWTVRGKASRGAMEVAWYPDVWMGLGMTGDRVDEGFAGRWFPRGWLMIWDDFGVVVRVAFWFVIFWFGMVWGGWMGWRWRRYAKMEEERRWKELAGE